MAGYLVAEIEITDLEGYKQYRAEVPAVIARHGGRYLVRGGATELLEGSGAVGRVVVLEFADIEKARAFYFSEDYQRILPLRLAASKGRAFLVDGV